MITVLLVWPGSLMQSLMNMVKEKDTTLWLKLQEQDMKPQFFAFRWLTLMLSQEFQLPGNALKNSQDSLNMARHIYVSYCGSGYFRLLYFLFCNATDVKISLEK